MGSGTDYKGSLYIDNIDLSQATAPDGYVTRTETPATTKAQIGLSSLNTPSSVTLADDGADSCTSDLDAYLSGVSKSGLLLYGHQNDSHHKVGWSGGSDSDTYDMAGEYPALFGIDGLSLTGAELDTSNPNVPADGDLVQGAANIGIAAAQKGAILTLSAHMPNFAAVAAKPSSTGNTTFQAIRRTIQAATLWRRF